MEALLSAPLDKCGNWGSELECLGKVAQRGRDSSSSPNDVRQSQGLPGHTDSISRAEITSLATSLLPGLQTPDLPSGLHRAPCHLGTHAYVAHPPGPRSPPLLLRPAALPPSRLSCRMPCLTLWLTPEVSIITDWPFPWYQYPELAPLCSDGSVLGSPTRPTFVSPST